MAGSESPTRIIDNRLDENRHAIAGGGNCSYEVAQLVLREDSHGVLPLVDMHGVNEHAFDDASYQAGVDIHDTPQPVEQANRLSIAEPLGAPLEGTRETTTSSRSTHPESSSAALVEEANDHEEGEEHSVDHGLGDVGLHP